MSGEEAADVDRPVPAIVHARRYALSVALVRRLLQLVPTFIGIMVITFLLVRLSPGEPTNAGLDGMAEVPDQALAAWRRLRGLDAPLASQLLDWFRRLATFDFGASLIDERPVSELLAQALPRTMALSASALAVTYLLSVPLGVYAATHRGRPLERALSLALFVLYALPSFWIALVLILFFAGGQGWQLFPLRGLASPEAASLGLLARTLDFGWHLVLPVICLSAGALARTSRLQRAAMLEVLNQGYIRTARAKGLSERRVIWGHAWRNALIPMVTQLSLDLPYLVGGSVIIERIFAIPGMGSLAVDAVLRRDYPVIMGTTTVAALVTIGSLLLGDLLHLWVDPRARQGEVLS